MKGWRVHRLCDAAQSRSWVILDLRSIPTGTRVHVRMFLLREGPTTISKTFRMFDRLQHFREHTDRHPSQRTKPQHCSLEDDCGRRTGCQQPDSEVSTSELFFISTDTEMKKNLAHPRMLWSSDLAVHPIIQHPEPGA